MGAWDEIKDLHKKSTAGAKEGIAFRWFSRPLASFILFHIQRSKWTPNQITILSLLVGMAGFLVHLFVLPWWGLMLGCALFMLAHVLDALDGQLARHRKAGSVIGMHFDFFIDALKAYMMYGALAVRLYQQVRHPGDGQGPWGGAYASPTFLLDGFVRDYGADSILLFTAFGMAMLATGIGCTEFMKKKEWKDLLPAASGGAGGFSLVGLAEKLGRFVVDYPSYILLLCLLNRVDAYFIAYTLVVAVYSARALFGITLRLWRINPYGNR
ncbi:MAG: CDP-alcohol phosphatidyltransferase family protein [Planctomycetes bacterium]|nr:CDP-alcohol phosphatidyltransferase family protein [Planctomycetota bacterium]